MHLEEVDPRNRRVRRDADVEPDPCPPIASRYFPGVSDHPVELAIHRVTMIACLVSVLAALAIMPARARSDMTASPGADSLRIHGAGRAESSNSQPLRVDERKIHDGARMNVAVGQLDPQLAPDPLTGLPKTGVTDTAFQSR